MSPNDAPRASAESERDETQRTPALPLAEETEVDLGRAQPAASPPNSPPRAWSKTEIAELARNFEGDTTPHPARAPGDPVLRRILASLGRRSKPLSGPVPKRPFSEGGDYVAYSATADPRPARSERPLGRTVLVDGSDAATALLPARRRKGVRRMLAAVQPVAFVALGAAAGVVGTRWAETPRSVPSASAALDRGAATAMQGDPVPGPPPGSPSSTALEAASARPSASVDPIVPRAARPPAPANRGAARQQALVPTKRAGDAAERKPGSHADRDEVMEAVGY